MKYLLTTLALGLGFLTGCAQQPSIPTTDEYRSLPLPAGDGLDLSEDLTSIPSVLSEPDNSTLPEKVSADTSENAWHKIVQGQSFSRHINNSRVNTYLGWYTGKQHHFDSIGTRARLYMAHIIEELERHNLPLELALLPFVESAYNPFAYSPSGAAGLWQFMRPTGDQLGLKHSHWYDGRRDIISSTNAAARYLKYLNKRFNGDWLLTLAAYNAGEGKVYKAIQTNLREGKTADFWSLQLPSETRAYVPKLVALAQVISAPGSYHLELPHIPSEVYFKIVDLPQQIHLYQVSLLAEMNIEGVFRLNPGCQQSATPPEGPFRLLIPKHKATDFETRLSSTPKAQWLKTLKYTIQSGDTLGEIAQRHKISVKSLMRQNKISSSKIRAGRVLKIPSPSFSSLPNFALPTQYYKVRRGDSLWKIAHAYQVKTRDLARWNNLDSKATLKIGLKLKIRSPGRQGQQRKLSYKVRKGDSLSLISKQFKVSVSDILRWNRIDAQGLIKTGETLKLFPHS